VKKPPSVGAKARKYPKSWDRLSTATRLEEPLCRMCLALGKTTPADAVDHIVPKSEGGSIHDPANLQPLCRQHHDQKTARDNARGTARGKFPANVRIVTGPPAAGKSTFVRERFAPGDLAFDWDAVASTLYGVGPWETTRDMVEPLRRVRGAVLAAGSEGWVPGTTWVIVSDLEQAERLADELHARLDVVSTSIDTCLERLASRPATAERRAEQHAAVTSWHARHRARGRGGVGGGGRGGSKTGGLQAGTVGGPAGVRAPEMNPSPGIEVL
jgi:5-methylcytosine-specific restriction protein A